MASRASHAARVGLPAGDVGPAAPTGRIVVEHHRAPRVEWNVEVASGGHMLHLALAQCVFNNVLRIAGERGLTLTAASVTADGGFNPEGTTSTGIECSIELTGSAPDGELRGIAEAAFADSTVAAVLRSGVTVELASIRVNQGSNAHSPPT
jgi:uncharacterized OsmC-like protein